MRKHIWVVIAAAFSSTLAVAQVREEITTKVGTKVKRGSVEVAPVPLLLNAMPRTGAGGAAAELFMTDHTSLMVDGTVVNTTLPTNVTKKADLKPDTLNGYRAAIGVQTYRTPGTSSWYWGGKAGYAASKGKWDYKGAKIDQETTSITPAVMGGYRWLFDNNLTFRVGASAGPNLIQTNSVEARDTTDNGATGRDKINTLAKAPVAAQMDLLVGYAF